MKSVQRTTHTIDATGKNLGRLATQIATLLRGKHKACFTMSQDVGDSVIIKNISKMNLTGNKITQKVYYKTSEYLGNLKEIPAKRMFENNPGRMLRLAVYGMIPKNKLRARQLKRLKVTD